jgi:cobalt/nickel transport system permease protein
MRDRLFLLLYTAAVVLATTIHSSWLLAGMLAGAVLLAGNQRWWIARRALTALALFTSVVLVAYTVSALIQDRFSGHYLTLIALRVLTLTYLTMLLAEKVNLFRAVGFSRTLLYLVTLATSQVLTMRRMFNEFRLAFRSRTSERPTWSALYHHGAATATYFINKSTRDAAEIAQAMRSRGFFDDQS